MNPGGATKSEGNREALPPTNHSRNFSVFRRHKEARKMDSIEAALGAAGLAAMAAKIDEEIWQEAS